MHLAPREILLAALLASAGCHTSSDLPEPLPPPVVVPCDGGGADGFALAADCSGSGGHCPWGSQCRDAADCASGHCVAGACAGFNHAPEEVAFSGDRPLSIAAGDLDGDGRTDLVVSTVGRVSFSPETVEVELQQPGGTFTRKVIAEYLAFATAVVDVNGDRHLDVIAGRAGSSSLTAYLGRGDGTFEGGVGSELKHDAQFLDTGDFDGDGHVDICASTLGRDGVILSRGRGDGTFAPAAVFRSSAFIAAVRAVDLDGDGHLDIAGSSTGGPVTLFFGHGDGTFEPAVDVPATAHGTWLSVADFDGDGRPDLAISSSDGCLVTLLNQGGRRFGARRSLPADGPVYGLAAADLDGDRITDLVLTATNPNGVVQYYPGVGDGTFRDAPFEVLGGGAGFVLPTDLDGDHRTDLAIAMAYGSGIWLLRNRP